MDTIAIGILHPHSSVLPMGKLFDKALRKALKANSEYDIEFYPEFIGQGSIKQVEDAVSKLINFHDVNVITGVFSSKVTMELSEKFKEHDVLFLPNNLGAQIMDPNRVSDNVFLNSPLLWQQTWSLGHWATKRFGNNAMFVGGVYDMAYVFTHVLDLGMRAVDPNCQWSFAVSHMPQDGETLSDPGVVMDFIEKEMPDFLFAAFCGKEASLFLDGFIERGFHTKIPLIATQHLLEGFSQKVDAPLKVYTPLSAGVELTDAALESDWTTVAGLFAAMGEDSAKIILKAATEGREALNAPVETQRGMVHLKPNQQGKGNKVYILENEYSGEKAALKRSILEEVATTDINNKGIQEGFKAIETSWLNPYLAV